MYLHACRAAANAIAERRFLRSAGGEFNHRDSEDTEATQQDLLLHPMPARSLVQENMGRFRVLCVLCSSILFCAVRALRKIAPTCAKARKRSYENPAVLKILFACFSGVSGMSDGTLRAFVCTTAHGQG